MKKQDGHHCIWDLVSDSKVDCMIFQMCPPSEWKSVQAYYVADDIYVINLPEHIDQLPQLGKIPEEGIIGYIS